MASEYITQFYPFDSQVTEDAYHSLVTGLRKSEEFNKDLDFFKNDDLLGRTWYTLHRTIQHIGTNMFPEQTRAGIVKAQQALFGMWVELRADSSRKGRKINKNLPPGITSINAEEASLIFKPFIDIVNRFHGAHRRQMIAELEVSLNETFLNSLGVSQEEASNAMLLPVVQYGLGTTIAFDMWRSLSTLPVKPERSYAYDDEWKTIYYIDTPTNLSN